MEKRFLRKELLLFHIRHYGFRIHNQNNRLFLINIYMYI